MSFKDRLVMLIVAVLLFGAVWFVGTALLAGSKMM